jgi:hypothetical protein
MKVFALLGNLTIFFEKTLIYTIHSPTIAGTKEGDRICIYPASNVHLGGQREHGDFRESVISRVKHFAGVEVISLSPPEVSATIAAGLILFSNIKVIDFIYPSR